MGVPRGRVKLIAAGTVSLIDCRRLARRYVYGRIPRMRPARPRPRGKLSEKVPRSSKKRAGNNVRDPERDREEEISVIGH